MNTKSASLASAPTRAKYLSRKILHVSGRILSDYLIYRLKLVGVYSFLQNIDITDYYDT